MLIYHPDKGKASEGELRTESVFACIQKAYEQVGISEEKRRAFDSVDPKFDEDTPDSVEPGEFFRLLGPVFERNSRFSILNKNSKFFLQIFNKSAGSIAWR